MFAFKHGIRVLEKKLDVNSVDIIHANSSREDFGHYWLRNIQTRCFGIFVNLEIMIFNAI